MSAVPILWLHDATAGDGKSGIGWELLVGTSRDGIKTAYVDLEYVGAFAPTPVGDPGNHRLKIGMLAAMWPAYQSTGVRCIVAFTSTGVADVADILRESIPDAVVTTCRADDAETVKTQPDAVPDVAVDTTGLGVDEVAEAVRAAARNWPFGDLEGSALRGG
ncbi:MAG: hypothetical protein QOD68_2266 [Actinomycetota bacterium]|nr:hypothetical protein [Actinomycetota bacterium]